MILLEPVAETAQTTRPEDTGAREVPGDQKAVQIWGVGAFEASWGRVVSQGTLVPPL